MKPTTRCYVRFIRDRWELYVSHYPQGTTYFFHSTDNTGPWAPPPDGWTLTNFSSPHEVLHLAALPLRPAIEPPTAALAPPPVAAEEPEFVLWSNATCPFAQRARSALLEKGLRFCEVEVDIVGERGHDPAALARSEAFRELWRSIVPNVAHRRPAIPLLQHRILGTGAVVALPESAVIIEPTLTTCQSSDPICSLLPRQKAV